MAGKGDKQRPTDHASYTSNYDVIFSKKTITHTHNIIPDGLSSHNGEYWYKCTKCGKSDWIASYGKKSQLNFYNQPCE